MKNNKVCNLLNINTPVLQGGMVWCSGWKLVKAVCQSGGLGALGAGSMTTEVLQLHIEKLRKSGINNFAVNIPLMNKHSDEHVKTSIENKVPIVITSAGNPIKHTQQLKAEGITVLHVVANTKFCNKAIEAGVDAIIAEGFEAGGHNGKDETTTLCLIPQIRKITSLPLIAAGGIASGESMYAAMALGADGVQIGSRFAIAKESSAHDLFKKAVIDTKDGGTQLTLKELAPVRLIKNDFFNEIITAYNEGNSVDQLRVLLGKGRSRKGIFEGDLKNGELEIGQVSGYLDTIESVQEIFIDLENQFLSTQNRMSKLNFK